MTKDKGTVRHKKNKDKTTKIHKVRTEDKEETNQIVNGCKKLIVKDKEGKENNERSKTEPRRVARDRNRVQEPRDKRDEDKIQDGPRETTSTRTVGVSNTTGPGSPRSPQGTPPRPEMTTC